MRIRGRESVNVVWTILVLAVYAGCCGGAMRCRCQVGEEDFSKLEARKCEQTSGGKSYEAALSNRLGLGAPNGREGFRLRVGAGVLAFSRGRGQANRLIFVKVVLSRGYS